MDKAKTWYTSKTVWAGIITVIVGAALEIGKVFGVDLASNQIIGVVISILGALGVYGRVTASTTLK
jgi:uncharacterized membrane protein